MHHNLVLDVETNGLPKKRNAKVTDLDNWPRVVQIAWALFDGPMELYAKSYIIAPMGWSIPVEASNVHGIPEEVALAVGVELKPVLDKLIGSILLADTVVCHNAEFDTNVVGAEYLRNGWGNPFEDRKIVCTMKSSTEYCNLPGRHGPKYPKLVELHQKLFGVGFDGAHDAMNDVRACYRCYDELQRLEVL